MIDLAERNHAGELAPVHRKSTAAVVADQLRSAIMYGALPPGTQMGEAELATQLGVSRGPLREAMQRLVQEGLLHSEPHRGLFVTTLDRDDVHDIYAARLAVERAACQQLLRHHREEAVSELTRVQQRMVDAVAAGDPSELSEADQEFHETLVRVSGSARLQRMAQTLLVETRMCLTALQDKYPPEKDLVAEHRELVEAIAAGDEDLLLGRLEEHMNDALARLGVDPV